MESGGDPSEIDEHLIKRLRREGLESMMDRWSIYLDERQTLFLVSTNSSPEKIGFVSHIWVTTFLGG